MPDEWQQLRQEVRQALARGLTCLTCHPNGSDKFAAPAGDDAELKTACQKLIDSPAGWGHLLITIAKFMIYIYI